MWTPAVDAGVSEDSSSSAPPLVADPYLELAAPAVAVAPAPSVPSVSVATLKRELALRRAKVAAKVMEVKDVKEAKEVQEVKEAKEIKEVKEVKEVKARHRGGV